MLWLRGRASILLIEGPWLDSPGLHAEVSLGKTLNLKLLLMCWSASCLAGTTISVWMYVWITVSCFGQKPLLNALKCKWCCDLTISLVGSIKHVGLSVLCLHKWKFLYLVWSFAGHADQVLCQHDHALCVISWRKAVAKNSCTTAAYLCTSAQLCEAEILEYLQG